MGPETGTRTDNVKFSGINDSLRPILRMLTSVAGDLDLSRSLFNLVAEERGILASQAPLGAGSSNRFQAFKEQLLARVLDAKEIDVSFDNFPYYLR